MTFILAQFTARRRQAWALAVAPACRMVGGTGSSEEDGDAAAPQERARPHVPLTVAWTVAGAVPRCAERVVMVRERRASAAVLQAAGQHEAALEAFAQVRDRRPAALQHCGGYSSVRHRRY
jgi:hypothetical protein